MALDYVVVKILEVYIKYKKQGLKLPLSKFLFQCIHRWKQYVSTAIIINNIWQSQCVALRECIAGPVPVKRKARPCWLPPLPSFRNEKTPPFFSAALLVFFLNKIFPNTWEQGDPYVKVYVCYYVVLRQSSEQDWGTQLFGGLQELSEVRDRSINSLKHTCHRLI